MKFKRIIKQILVLILFAMVLSQCSEEKNVVFGYELSIKTLDNKNTVISDVKISITENYNDSILCLSTQQTNESGIAIWDTLCGYRIKSKGNLSFNEEYLLTEKHYFTIKANKDGFIEQSKETTIVNGDNKQIEFLLKNN